MFVVKRVQNFILAPSGLRYVLFSVAPMGHNRILYTMYYKYYVLQTCSPSGASLIITKYLWVHDKIAIGTND